MKSIKRIMIFLLTLAFLTGCKKLEDSIKITGISEEVKRPSLMDLRIRGTWELDRILPLAEISPDILSKYKLGEKFYISEGLVKINDRVTTSPSFKSRYVNLAMLYSSTIPLPVEMDELLKGEGKVYTVYDGQVFRQDFLILSDEEIGFAFENIFFKLKRIEDTVPDEIIAQYDVVDVDGRDESYSTDLNQEDTVLLLGVRTPKTDMNGNPYTSYKTIYIRRTGDSEPVVYAFRNLFLPRNTGFWSVGMEHIIDSDATRDILFAYPIAGGVKENSRYSLGDRNNCSITYLTKNYISLELYDYLSDNKRYGIFDLNKLIENSKLGVADIAGVMGVDSFKNDTLKIIGETADPQTVDQQDMSNICIRRSNGRTEFRSNIVIRDSSKIITRDYTINMIPTIDIISNVNLSVPWDDIKTKIPTAIDAYTSPDNDLLVVHSSNELLVYELKNGIISNNSLISIHISESDRIVMAEWATNKLASSWQDAIYKQERLPIEATK